VAAAARTSIAATSCHTCNTCQKITQLSVFTTTGRRRRCGLQLREPLPTSSNGVGCSSKEHHTTSNSNSRRRCSAMASAGLSMHSEKPIPSVPVMPRSAVSRYCPQTSSWGGSLRCHRANTRHIRPLYLQQSFQREPCRPPLPCCMEEGDLVAAGPE